MTDKRVLLVSEDGAAEVGGKEYVLVPRVEKPAPRIVFRVMYDCHMFDKLEATTPDAAVEEWLAKYSEDQQAYINGHSEPQNIGRPDLCPMSIIYGPKDERRYGPMVYWRRDIYDKAQLERWRVECNKAIADMNAMLSAAALDLSGLPRVPERQEIPLWKCCDIERALGFNEALDAIGA